MKKILIIFLCIMFFGAVLQASEVSTGSFSARGINIKLPMGITFAPFSDLQTGSYFDFNYKQFLYGGDTKILYFPTTGKWAGLVELRAGLLTTINGVNSPQPLGLLATGLNIGCLSNGLLGTDILSPLKFGWILKTLVISGFYSYDFSANTQRYGLGVNIKLIR